MFEWSGVVWVNVKDNNHSHVGNTLVKINFEQGQLICEVVLKPLRAMLSVPI